MEQIVGCAQGQMSHRLPVEDCGNQKAPTQGKRGLRTTRHADNFPATDQSRSTPPRLALHAERQVICKFPEHGEYTANIVSILQWMNAGSA
jgi:hypothetical protein